MTPVDLDVDVWITIGESDAKTWVNEVFGDIGGADISTANAYHWTSAQMSRIPVFSSELRSPVYFDASTNNFVELPLFANGETWAANNYVAKSIRSFGQYLVAMNITQGGVPYPDMVHWSDPALLGDVPRAWDTDSSFEGNPGDSTTTLANRFTLGGNGGDIIDGYSLGNALAIYRTNGIAMLDATNDTTVFQVRYLTEIIGIPNVRCISEVKGSHFILTPDDILINDSNRVSSILHNRLRAQFAREFNTEHLERAFVATNTNAKEIWFCISIDSVVDRAYVYNYRDDTWSVRDMPGVTHGKFGPRNLQALTYDEWDEVGATYDELRGYYDQGETQPTDRGMIAAGGSIFYDCDSDSPSDPIPMTLARESIYLDGIDRAFKVVGVYPDIESAGEVRIRLGAQDVVNGPIRWSGQEIFRPGIDKKVEPLIAGTFLSYEITSETNQAIRVNGLTIEYEEAGRR